MTEPIIETVRRRLTDVRGSWVDVARDSGVPYHTLTKIAQGVSPNPRVQTVQQLLDYFNRCPNGASTHPVTVTACSVTSSAPPAKEQARERQALPWPACGERRSNPPEVPGSGAVTRRRNPDVRSAEKAL